ncbi:KAP family P-loop NTPase fold protein [Curtobacterium flaccumfaciens]|uniref:KAP family P-loop NTPase fold protein n=1 Tax=Curtobacterium flaccumfaciens TaxID=2035 RepID=UPI001BDFD3FF|nr:P-loop NTPase fold protein [Curtobacterium flaccumfaciens]MBT1585315.1 KAP family NTPase [Curtobacterium flaccumfaciens pv. flaccumfaciens]MCX2799583.1 P-loop NTPase fold protein [Curtobacterium flaccumfaciens pv. flaccumfaciens]
MSGPQMDREKPPIDAPITSSDEDNLGRAPVAQEFAETLRELDASKGLVVGVLGPWGHGKSSFINLMREQFAINPALTVIDFNPWMFSGSDQLVNFFFTEIGAELSVRNRSRFGRTADWLSQYAGLLKPVSQFVPIPGAAAVGEAAAAALGGLSSTTDADRSAKKVREEISAELSTLPQPIVVVIDDIDRLTTVEIREIFKLVRLTASFANIIYVLAFDRERVEHALTEDGIPGRAYLEKIVQVSFDVPQAPDKLLRSQIFEELDRILAPVTDATLDENRWSDVYWEVIDPLISNMRDVTRYAISARSTVKSLGNEVDLVDLLAVEALRVFRPELVQQLSKLRTELTSARDIMGRKDERAQETMSALFTRFPDDGDVLRALINRVFPVALQYIENNHYGSDWASTWRTAHRMAHIDFLNLYFDRVAPDELVAFRGSEQAFQLLHDGPRLRNYLSGLDRETLETVIEGLTSYESRFTSDMVVPTSITLLNLIDSIPEKKHRGFFEIGRRNITVRRVILRLLRRIEDEAEREALVSEILESVETYSSQLDLIHSVGYRENAGLKLVGEAFVAQLQAEFVERLQGTPPSAPSREWDAWRIYDTVQTETGEVPLGPSDDPVLLLAVLRSLQSTARSQSSNSRQVVYEDRLAWELLIQVFGSESALREAVESIRATLDDNETLQLADKYLSGWRPDAF